MEQSSEEYNLKFYGIDIECPNLYIDNLELAEILEVFENFSTSVYCKEISDGGSCIIELIFREEPNLDGFNDLLEQLKSEFSLEIKSYDQKIIDDCNWLLHVYENFPPIVIDNFYVYGSHYEGEIPSDLTGLQINAATAFGSGEHGTTKGCLESLQKLAKDNQFKNILDMGCGSGILAIAASKLWADAEITAVDIDEEAIRVTDHHLDLNHCTDRIKTEAGDGYHADIVKASNSYDLIIANILAAPLKLMAEDLSKNLSDNGICVLAGLLRRQEQDILDIHAEHGLKLLNSFNIDNWQILTMQKA